MQYNQPISANCIHYFVSDLFFLVSGSLFLLWFFQIALAPARPPNLKAFQAVSQNFSLAVLGI